MFINCSMALKVVSFVTILELAGYLALIILYSQLLSKFGTVNVSMYEYLRDNQCTDGALARGIEEILNSIAKDRKVVSVGFAFVLASAASTILIYIFTNIRIRNYLSSFCGCFGII
jgi:high-affinity nickel permease